MGETVNAWIQLLTWKLYRMLDPGLEPVTLGFKSNFLPSRLTTPTAT